MADRAPTGKCKRCGELYYDGEKRCTDECAAGSGSMGYCGGDVEPVADRAPVWKGDGREMVPDGNGWRHPLLPIDICHGFVDGYDASYDDEPGLTERWGDTPQAALDALHARLCEQHDALGRVTGRGTVAQVAAWLRRRAADVDGDWREYPRSNAYLEHVPRYLSDAADRVDRGEHIPTHEETE